MAAHAKPNIVFDNRSTGLASEGTYSVPLPGQGEAMPGLDPVQASVLDPQTAALLQGASVASGSRAVCRQGLRLRGRVRTRSPTNSWRLRRWPGSGASSSPLPV